MNEPKDPYLTRLPPSEPPTVEHSGPAESSPPTNIEQTFATSFGDAPQSPQVPELGHRFGDYELLEEIGRGGMGVIFRARQVSLGRVVALKMILAGSYATGETVERFRAEAKAAANLHHPNIVPIHEIGMQDGRHFFSMDYVDGGSLHQLLTKGPLPPRDAARLLLPIAEALEHAHRQGIVHRDIKPANILLASGVLERAGDTIAGRTQPPLAIPRLTDFGLAKFLESGSGLTASGETMGTPSFMPPEQASGKSREVGPRSDIYSLGAVLYTMLTGRPPFQAATAVETLRLVVECEPLPPHQLNPVLPRDLETICLTCLQKEPARRYASAQELADELQRFLDGQPIKARPVGALERAWRWCRRNPAMAASLAAVFVSLLLGAAISTYFAFEAIDRADESEIARLHAEDSEEKAKRDRLKAEEAEAEAKRDRLKAEAAEGKAKGDRLKAEEAEAEAKASATFAAGQSDLALKSLETLVSEVQEQLKDAPGTAELRKKLLETALAGLTRQSKGADQARGASTALAEARIRFGDLFQQFGDTAAAQREYEVAVELSRKLYEQEKTAISRRLLLARSLRNLAGNLFEQARAGDARAPAQEALRLLDEVLVAEPKHPEARRLLSNVLTTLGKSAQASEDLAKAREFLDRRLQVDQELATAEPNSVRAGLALADAHRALAEVLHKSDDVPAARKEIDQAIKLLREAVKEKEHSRAARLLLSKALLNRGDIANTSDGAGNAREDFEEAQALGREIYQEDKQNADVAETFLRALQRVGDLHSKNAFERGEAREAYLQALLVARGRLERAPAGRPQLQDYANVCGKLGQTSYDLSGFPGARQHFREQRETLQRLYDNVAKRDEAVGGQLVTAQLRIGESCLKMGDLDGAKTECAKAVAWATRQKIDNSLFVARCRYAVALYRLDEIEPSVREFLAVQENKEAVQKLLTTVDRADLYLLAGHGLMRLARHAEAERQFQQVEALAREYLKKSPLDFQAQAMTGLLVFLQASSKAEQLQFAEAHKLAVKSLEVVKSTKLFLAASWRREAEAVEPWTEALQHADAAIKDESFIASQPFAVAHRLWLIRVRVLASRKDVAATTEAASKLRKLAGRDQDALFESGMAYALLAGIDGKNRNKHLEECFAALKEAVINGFHRPDVIRTEPYFQGLRDEKGFDEVLRLARTYSQDVDRRLTKNSIGMEFVLIPRGKFTMGSKEKPEEIVTHFNKLTATEQARYFVGEQPPHEVEITQPFHFGMTEVTTAQFRAFVAATNYKTDAEREGSGGSGSFNPAPEGSTTARHLNWKNPDIVVTSEEHPVVQVSYNDAVAFCKWLSQKEGVRYRLPTEAEWEYACRAGTTTRFWNGDDEYKLIEIGNVPDGSYRRLWNNLGYTWVKRSDGYGHTSAAGEYAANSWGLYDVHGNVWEWCQDGFDASFYESSPKKDPQAPPGLTHVIRGGCYM